MNKELLKITLVLGSMPIWLPFAKALWEEFRDAMRGDGGFSGPTPTDAQRREIEAELAKEESRLIDEPLALVRSRRTSGDGGSASPAPGRAKPSAPRRSGGERRFRR